MTKDRFLEELEKLNIKIDVEQQKKLDKFYTLLIN